MSAERLGPYRQIGQRMARTLVGASLASLLVIGVRHVESGHAAGLAPYGPAVTTELSAHWQQTGGEVFTDSPPPVGVIGAQDAVDDATTVYHPDGNGTLIAARYGLFTNTHQFVTDASGARHYVLQNVQVWLLRYSNVTKPLLGKPGSITGEYDVLVSAESGAYLRAFMDQ